MSFDPIFQILSAHERGNQSRDVIKSTFHNFTLRLFSTLPEPVFKEVLRKYQTDIELFGYHEIRDEIQNAFL